MPTSFSIACAVVVAIGISAAAWSGNGRAVQPAERETEARRAGASTAVTPVAKDDAWWRGRHESFNARAAQAREKGDLRVIFIGDSITQGWGEAGRAVWEERYAPLGAANFGISGDRTQHVLWRIDHGNLEGLATPAAGRPPELVVIMIGTNNSTAEADNTAEEIGAGVVRVVERVREKLPRTKVLLLGIFPRGERPNAQREKNARASAIAARVADGEWVHSLDIEGNFMDEEGKISPEVMPDFLHLSERGYEIWADAMEGKMKELLGEG